MPWHSPPPPRSGTDDEAFRSPVRSRWRQAPAVAEFLPDFEVVAWHGFFVPAGTPKPIVEKLSAEIRAFMQQPETVQKLAELGATAVVVDSEPFAAYIAAETARWKK